jgi:hypothetical protein
MNVSRRLFVTTAPAALAGLTLVRCSATQIDAGLKQAAADTATIAVSLKNALPVIAGTNGISSAVVARVGVAVADIQTVAAAVAAAATPAAALPSVQQLEVDFNAIVNSLAGLPLPPPISSALTAASVLLPIIELAVGMIVPPSASKMTPDEARAILKGI